MKIDGYHPFFIVGCALDAPQVTMPVGSDVESGPEHSQSMAVILESSYILYRLQPGS
jgi:hypothetical protein